MPFAFQVDADELREALRVVDLFKPSPLTSEGEGAIGFQVAPDARGQARGAVYMRDATRVVRAEFAVREVQGHGQFLYPAGHVASFGFAEGPVEFQAEELGDGARVRYRFGGHGAGTERPTLNPQLLTPIDAQLAATTWQQTYPTEVFRLALKLAEPLTKGAQAEEPTISVFGGRAELFSRTYSTRFHFRSEVLRGPDLHLHPRNVSVLATFLDRCPEEVELRGNNTWTFAVAGGATLGWTNSTAPLPRHARVAPDHDRTVLMVPVSPVLGQLRYLRAEMETGYPAVRVLHEGGTLQFLVARFGARVQSMALEVSKVSGPPFQCETGVGHLIGLFEGLKSIEAELRLVPLEALGAPAGATALRTVDEFWMEADGKIVGGRGANPSTGVRCEVERFVSNIVRGGA
jgi:hypothetical protein